MQIVTIPFSRIDSRIDQIEDLLYIIQKQIEKMDKPSTIDPEQLLTKKEAASLASCATSTLDNWCRAGRINKFHVGRSVRYKRREVIEAATKKA